jgi:hypothetical protein
MKPVRDIDGHGFVLLPRQVKIKVYDRLFVIGFVINLGEGRKGLHALHHSKWDPTNR